MGEQRDIPRWKRWMHVMLPALLSGGLVSLALGLAFGSLPNLLLGAFFLGGFMRGIVDRQIRRGGYRL